VYGLATIIRFQILVKQEWRITYSDVRSSAALTASLSPSTLDFLAGWLLSSMLGLRFDLEAL
jgi:hypothetical protein